MAFLMPISRPSSSTAGPPSWDDLETVAKYAPRLAQREGGGGVSGAPRAPPCCQWRSSAFSSRGASWCHFWNLPGPP
eukprot:8818579-Pyramimonas_sp.AAC.1